MAVHPYLSLAPCLEVQEGVARLFQGKLAFEISAVTKNRLAALHVIMSLAHCLLDGIVVITHGDDAPVFQVPCHFMTIDLCLQEHFFGDAFEVLDGPSEIDTSHGFHQNIQHLTFLHRR